MSTSVLQHSHIQADIYESPNLSELNDSFNSEMSPANSIQDNEEIILLNSSSVSNITPQDNTTISNEYEYYTKKISKTLETLVVSTTKQQSTQTYSNIHSIFYCNDIPPISLNDYLIRIQKYTNIEISTLICALIYIDRFTSIGNIKIDFNNICS